jgi:hypothetical protein
MRIITVALLILAASVTSVFSKSPSGKFGFMTKGLQQQGVGA